MPAETITETVTLDRQAVMDLLVEATGAVEVLDQLLDDRYFSGSLETRIDAVAGAMLGPSSGDGSGSRDRLWRDGETHGQAYVDHLSSKAAEMLLEELSRMSPRRKILVATAVYSDDEEADNAS
jgi:hypothetical protein